MLDLKKAPDAREYAYNMIGDINVNGPAYKTRVIKKIQGLKALSATDRSFLVWTARRTPCVAPSKKKGSKKPTLLRRLMRK